MLMWAVSKSYRIVALSFIFVIAILTSQITISLASNSEITSVNTRYPSLFVTKVVDKTEVTLGESFLVTITITNFGNKTAFNVTFVDDLTAEWVFKITGLTRISYSQIEPNQTRTFSYIVTAISKGNYQLHSARVYYYTSDVQPDEFLAISNALDIIVAEPTEDFSLANYNTVVTFLLVLLVLNILLTLRLITPKLNRRNDNQ
jgi:uncharacterized repeat protein (TIGR01451 family)